MKDGARKLAADFKQFLSSREEDELIPTDCAYSLKLVNFRTKAIIPMQIAVMNTGVGTGIPGMKLPKYPKRTSLIEMLSLLLIHAAIERPAVKRISVATIGCILKNATRAPLKAPNKAETTTQRRNAQMITTANFPPDIFGEHPLTILNTVEPAIAIVAPTEIS